MSSNDEALSSAQQQPHTAAADVSFTKLNNEHHAESSSQAESKGSVGKRSSLSDRLVREKEKRFSSQETPGAGDSGSNDSSSHKKKTGGFLLDSVFTHTTSRLPETTRYHARKAQLNERRASDRRSYADQRFSGESSQRSSPLAREISDDRMDQTGSSTSQIPRPSAMDPAQLVQMALNLSESRKRHVSNLPVPVSPAGARRAAVDSAYGTVKSNSSAGKRASHLENGLRLASPTARKSSHHEAELLGDTIPGDNVFYTFTPATLSRAEKARRYFELASEHRRLLEHLPPLKPDATAQGNYAWHSTSSPGSAHYDMTRVPSYNNSQRQLGRKYNPLQALRNRRLRNRERRPLTAPPETWQETDRIKRWIDGVEAASKDSMYRPGDDLVRLPAFSGELEAEAARTDTTKHHRRTDTASSVITRPANGWTIEPAELLADTYWVERDDNKMIIEDRNGNRIFPPRPYRPQSSAGMPRHSRDSTREHIAGPDKQSQPEDSADEDRTRSRHRSKLPIPNRLRRNHISRSASTTSKSSDEGRKPPQFRYGALEGGDENVGPLERHMRTMIAKEENGELSSPELVSPDYWDSKYTPFPNLRSGMDQSQSASKHVANVQLSVETTDHRRSRSAEGRMASISNGMSSVDELSPSSPTSPNIPGVGGMDPSSAVEQRLSLDLKRKQHHLPILRSHSKERNNIEQSDFAANVGKPLSPVMSADNTEQPRTSTDSSRPGQFERQKTAENTTTSLLRQKTADTTTKESNSKRFFKGGRIGELVRGESSRLGDRFRGGRERNGDLAIASDGSRVPTDESDIDVIPNGSGRDQHDDLTDSDVSPRASLEHERSKSKYYTSNLPNFKSANGRNNRSSVAQTPMSEASDPFTKRESLQRESDRRRRFLPPTINAPTSNGVSNANMSETRSKGFSTGYDSDRPSSRTDLSLVPTNTTLSQPRRNGNLPMTGLAKEDSKRHWSISDQAPSGKAAKVTTRDVARVRALLLASGIKAREIYFKADSVRVPPLPYLISAANTAGQKFEDVTRKQENLVAARMLSGALDSTTSNFEKSLQYFQTTKAKQLGTEVDELSHRAAEQLTKIVHETSDEADAFNVELTTKQPQEIKRVDDAIDAMFRQRNRQFRWLRRTGFKLLEWLVLGIMWWVWFVVVLFNTGKKFLFGLLHVLRWLLWF